MKEPPVKTDPALNRAHFKSALDRSRAKRSPRIENTCEKKQVGTQNEAFCFNLSFFESCRFPAFPVWCGRVFLARFGLMDLGAHTPARKQASLSEGSADAYYS